MKGLWLIAVLFITKSLAASVEFPEIPETEDVDGGYNAIVTDPCAEKHCGPGKVCDLDDDDRPVCVCIPKCPVEEEDSAKVCSTSNVTFESECELHRQKCLCHHNSPACEDHHYRKAHLDYYGPCIEMRVCTEVEMEEFPLRMRNWFYHVMEELAERNDLPEPAAEMAREAREHNHQWVLPTIWRFCDLDITHDRLISAEELLPIAAPLKPLEHCTGPFLVRCDADQSGYISLEEWGLCLGLDNDEIEDRCDVLRD